MTAFFTSLIFCIFLLPLQGSCSKTTGFQVVGTLPEDTSLLKKLKDLPEDERKTVAPEYDAILTELIERISGASVDDAILHEEITINEGLEIFGPSLRIDNYQEDPHVKAIFSKSFAPQFYFARASSKAKVNPENYFTEAELEEIYKTAKEILNKTSGSDHLISLGQSPAYIVEALEELATHDFRRIYKVPCSGAPDYSCLNRHYKHILLSNVTTDTSLAYYKQVLRTKGVSPEQLGSHETIYVIDLVGTGGSFASFLKILVRWYDSVGIPLPEIKLLDISVETRNFKNENRIILPLADNCHIHIDRLFIHTSAHLSDKLDYTEGEDRTIPPFSALQWKPEYERVFTQYPNHYALKVIQAVRGYVRNTVFKAELKAG